MKSRQYARSFIVVNCIKILQISFLDALNSFSATNVPAEITLVNVNQISKAPATNVWQAMALVKPKAYDHNTRRDTLRIGYSG